MRLLKTLVFTLSCLLWANAPLAQAGAHAPEVVQIGAKTAAD